MHTIKERLHLFQMKVSFSGPDVHVQRFTLNFNYFSIGIPYMYNRGLDTKFRLHVVIIILKSNRINGRKI